MDELARTGLAETMRRHTVARVGLDSAGPAVGTAAQLEFQLDHALARDAVHARLDTRGLLDGLAARGLPAMALKSAADGDRQLYLRRPDLGRRLHAESAELLDGEAGQADVVFVVADGLSALAVDRHALAVLDAALPLLEGWRVGPVCVVEQGRVAVGDEIGAKLKARMTVMLIGERPGLSAADSLGVYLTWEPRVGRTDAERNCISNIRREGLGYEEAARRIVFYMNGARRLGASGVALKETGGGLLDLP
jgi:ethanolamine ammonia-lyase small subunit